MYAIIPEKSNEDIVKILLEHGAYTDTQNKDGKTPLMEAVYEGKKKVVELLLDHGADVNIRDRWGCPVIRWILVNEKINKDIVELLLNHGADVNIQDKHGSAALHELVTPVCDDERSVENEKEIAELLLSHGADINLQNEDGETALMKVARRDNKEMVEFLLNHGADVNISNNEGDTVLTLSKLSISNFIKRYLRNMPSNVPEVPKKSVVENTGRRRRVVQDNTAEDSSSDGESRKTSKRRLEL